MTVVSKITMDVYTNGSFYRSTRMRFACRALLCLAKCRRAEGKSVLALNASCTQYPRRIRSLGMLCFLVAFVGLLWSEQLRRSVVKNTLKARRLAMRFCIPFCCGSCWRACK